MVSPRKLTIIGFVIGFLALALIGIGVDKEKGVYLFIVGFYIASIGIVLSIISEKFEGWHGANGLKIAALGFLINSVNFLVEFFNWNASIGSVLSWVGGTTMAIGLLLCCCSTFKQK